MTGPTRPPGHDVVLAVVLVVLVGAVCAVGALSSELVQPSTGSARTTAAVVMTLLGCAAVAWRQVAPLAVLAGVTVLQVLVEVADPVGYDADSFAATAYAVIAFPWLLSLYTVVVLCRARVSAPVTAAVAVLSAVSLVAQGGVSAETPWEITAAVLVCLVVWLLGRAGRRRQERRRELAERWEGLGREQAQVRAAERSRLARELHDVAAHHLSSIVVTVGAAERLVAAEPARAVEAARFAAETGSRTQEALRQMVQAMAVEPAARSAPGAAPAALYAIDGLVEQFSTIGLAVRLDVHGRPAAMHPEVALTTYRIVQEGLTNALRHSGATAVEVTIRHGGGEVGVTVSDDGSGTGAASHDGTRSVPAVEGYGLTGMRERVEAVGGRLDAGPGPVGGWRLAARMPEVPSGRPVPMRPSTVRRGWVDAAARRRREWIGDGALAVLLSVLVLLSWDRSVLPVLVLALAHTCALAWRRRSPWAVLAAVVTAHAVLAWVEAGDLGVPTFVTVLVALWTVGTRCRPVSLSYLAVLPATVVLGLSLTRVLGVGAGGPGDTYEAMSGMFAMASLLWGAGVGWGLLRDPTGGIAGERARADQALAQALVAEREHVAGALQEQVQCHVSRLVGAAELAIVMAAERATEVADHPGSPSGDATLVAALGDVRSEGREALAAMRSLLGLLRSDDTHGAQADEATLAPPRRMAEQFTAEEPSPS